METIHACGKRGLGDIVKLTSTILTLYSNKHIVFHFPPGFDYKSTIKTLMDQYDLKEKNLTYEVDETWYTIDENVAKEHFGDTPFIFKTNIGSSHYPFKQQWKGNTDSYVCLCLNNENTRSDYPYPEKWFDKKTDRFLNSLVDNKNYFVLGRPLSVQQNIDLMENCSLVIGTDGGWAHVANSMNVPYILVRNDISLNLMKHVHLGHPTLKIIETHDLLNYLV